MEDSSKQEGSERINFLGHIAKPYIEEISDVVKELILNNLSDLNKPGYKQAVRAIPLFTIKILHLSNGIIDLIISDNIYSSKMLLRSLVEHAFKINFLTKKSIQESNGKIFEEYYLFCDLAEELQYQKNLDYKSKILDDQEIDEKAYQELIEKKPEIKKYSKRTIFEKSNQFTFRNTFKYANESEGKIENIDNIELIRKGEEGFLMLGGFYSDLSSFVHGGPFAESYVFPSKDPEDDNKEILDIVENVMVIHFYANLRILEFWNNLNPKYKDEIIKINDLMLDYYQKV